MSKDVNTLVTAKILAVQTVHRHIASTVQYIHFPAWTVGQYSIQYSRELGIE